MTRTVISSATREVVIGDDQPFVVIGERINPTGRKVLAEEMKAGDFSRVERDTIAQVEAGAHMLDVNAGIPLADEPAILAKTIQLVQSLTDLPLSIDSSIVEALEAGLAVYQGKALLNSVTGEEERLERVLPLVKKYGCAVVAISNDETGISMDPDVRFAVAKRIVERAADHGIPREDIVVDPLLMPIGALAGAGRQVFRILGRLRDELKVNSTCGASNVSFGLPNREGINGAFLSMAIASGLTSAITNPIAEGVRHAVMASDVLMGNDQDARAGSASSGSRRPTARPAAAGSIAAAAAASNGAAPGASRPTFPASTSRGSTSRPRADGGPDGPDRGRDRSAGHLHAVRPTRSRAGPGRPCSMPRARSASTSMPCAAAAGSAVAARSRRPSGRSRSTASRPRRITSPSRASSRRPIARSTAWPRTGGCRARPRCSATRVIDVPPESQVHRQVVRKDLAARAFEMDPVVRLHTVDVTRARPGHADRRPRPAVRGASRREWGLTDLRADLAVDPRRSSRR